MRFKIKEVHSWLNNLPENKWRKIYKVDAKRVAHFVNHGSNATLPTTLSRKFGDATFLREKKLAKNFVLHKIDEKKQFDRKSNKPIVETFNKKLLKIIYEEIIKLDRSGILKEKISQEVRELRLFIDNDARIYKSRYIPILKNLSKFKKKGKYESKLAIKAFMYLIDDGVKQYIKNYGGDQSTFSKKDKLELAKDYTEEFESQYNNQESLESSNETPPHY